MTTQLRAAVLFDMDHTLIDANSAYLYMKYLRRQGRVSLMDMARGAYWMLQYRLHVIDMESVSRRAFARMRGDVEAEILARNDAWFEELVRPLIFPEARALVEAHQRAGRVVAIVTASTRYAAEPLARHLGIEHCISTHLEVDAAGRFTGRHVEPLCYGEGKVEWVRRFAAAQGLDLARSWFYTDSRSDLPLMEAVGHPVAVNPDPRLLRRALRARWPILHFRSPG